MKINEPVTQNEVKLSDSTVIISTTDLKGQITSINEEFVKISGFSEDELLNKNHNIVRHPDMPPAAFQNLWDSVKVNQPWLGIVKNRCKNGDYYWVKAYVAAIVENGETIGYQSVRKKASDMEIQRAEKTYQRLNNKKKAFSKSFGVAETFMLMIVLCCSAVGIGYYFSLQENQPLYAYSGLLIGAIIGFLMSMSITNPIKNAAKNAKQIINNPVAQQIITGQNNEFGQVMLAMDLQQNKLETLRYRASHATHQLEDSAEHTANSVDSIMTSINQERDEIEQVATAINEMTATVEEVNKNITDTANSAREAKKEVNNINHQIAETIGIISSLETDMQGSAEVIHKLADNSQNIGAVLDVIQNIAEQTNLLALNAAIEAARAGEAGRGFAVVADEVRILATRTGESTQEIEKIIEQIQNAATGAVGAIDIAKKRAEESFSYVENTAESICSVTQAVDAIESMSNQIASAAEQQNLVSQEINRSIHLISESVSKTAGNAEQTAETAVVFIDLSKDLKKVIQQSG